MSRSDLLGTPVIPRALRVNGPGLDQSDASLRNCRLAHPVLIDADQSPRVSDITRAQERTARMGERPLETQKSASIQPQSAVRVVHKGPLSSPRTIVACEQLAIRTLDSGCRAAYSPLPRVSGWAEGATQGLPIRTRPQHNLLKLEQLLFGLGLGGY